MLAACGDSGTGPDSETTTYTVDVSSTDGGSVDPSGSDEYEEGEEIEIKASPNDEYMFSGWTGDVESSDNPLTLTVDQDYELIANFGVVSYELTVNTDGEGDVAEEIVQEKSTDYESGTVVELTANPADGWQFVEWTGDLTGNENPQEITMDGPKEVMAVFEQQNQAFYVAENGVTIKCEDAEVGDTGTIDGVTYTKRTADGITTDNAETTCTSGITDMSGMFGSDDTFNGDISHWDVSSVTDMNSMFFRATSFNGDLSNWDVSNVVDMGEMFFEATTFNRDLTSWDVSNVTNMSRMFERNNTFNGDISTWNVSSVTEMKNMFDKAEAFSGDLSSWNVSKVTDMENMFSEASSFNSDISGWNVSEVTDMQSMFYGADSFNRDLSNWNVSSVTDMRSMFAGADAFNGDISSWNVSNVEFMSSMFEHADSFNRNIGSWDVSNVTSMTSMFEDAASFNQDISGWCVSNIESEPDNFSNGSPLIDDYKPEWGTCPS
jgi:surface protein